MNFFEILAYKQDPDQKEGVPSQKKKNRNIANKGVNLIVFKEICF